MQNIQKDYTACVNNMCCINIGRQIIQKIFFFYLFLGVGIFAIRHNSLEFDDLM